MNLKTASQKSFILKTILNLADVAVHMVDGDGITRFYNLAAAEMDGMKPEDVLGRHILEVYPSLTLESSSLLQVLKIKQPILDRQQTVVNRAGRTVIMSYSTYPICYQNEIIGACDISRDITRIKELSEKLLDLQAELLGKKYNQQKKEAGLKENLTGAGYTINDLIGQNSKIIELKVLAQRVARSNSPVLVYGETGTGKELLVQAIHNAGSRSSGPFIAQNCAALPATLLESILFGTVRGSFTGAEDRPGLFEMADGGTLFFDEINSMPVELQGKLLRVLQEGTLRRIGDSKLKKVNVRVVASTNIEPLDAVKKQQLRLDLYYRLNVVSLQLPPLRERPDDLQMLVCFFIESYNEKFGLQVQGIGSAVRNIFDTYNWPGNVRELKHCLEHAMNIVDGPLIEEKHLPAHITRGLRPPAGSGSGVNLSRGLNHALKQLEKEAILEALEQSAGNISSAARRLRIPRQTLQYKLKSYGLPQDGEGMITRA
ncbi:MAG: sigma 54-interacting transcriptional regulator [Dethiobacter sp.]|nr:sigma 54-interacting transcriptional regulator [Dethiobacter sp.]